MNETLELMRIFGAEHRIWMAAIFGLFGATVGSFLNVVIYRLPLDKSIVRPRSFCPGCGQAIAWYDNIPVFSYLFLCARCRHCRAHISWRYPLVELLTAGLWVALFWRFGLGRALPVHIVFATSLVAISFIDFDHRIIPNEISLPGIVVGFACSFLWYDQGFHWESLIGLLAGGGGLLLISIVYLLLRGREGMGMGDVKLLAMLGAWLGWKSLLFILLFASVQGILATIGMVVFGVKLKPPLPEEWELEEMEKEKQAAQAEQKPEEAAEQKEEGSEEEEEGSEEEEEEVPFMGAAIPFGPFLALSAIEYLFLGPWFFSFISGHGA